MSTSPSLPADELGVRPLKACPRCGGAGMTVSCRPRPFNPEALFWGTHACPRCDYETSRALEDSRALGLLSWRQRQRDVDPRAFRAGWEDPTLMLRFRALMHEGEDETAGFLSLHAGGLVAPARGFGWSAQLEPFVCERLLRRARALRDLKDQTGKYESYRFLVRDVDGRVIDRQVGFDWEMGVEINYDAETVKEVSTTVRAFQALSYEAGFRPLSFRRDLELLFAPRDPAEPSRDR